VDSSPAALFHVLAVENVDGRIATHRSASTAAVSSLFDRALGGSETEAGEGRQTPDGLRCQS